MSNQTASFVIVARALAEKVAWRLVAARLREALIAQPADFDELDCVRAEVVRLEPVAERRDHGGFVARIEELGVSDRDFVLEEVDQYLAFLGEAASGARPDARREAIRLITDCIVMQAYVLKLKQGTGGSRHPLRDDVKAAFGSRRAAISQTLWAVAKGEADAITPVEDLCPRRSASYVAMMRDLRLGTRPSAGWGDTLAAPPMAAPSAEARAAHPASRPEAPSIGRPARREASTDVANLAEQLKAAQDEILLLRDHLALLTSCDPASSGGWPGSPSSGGGADASVISRLQHESDETRKTAAADKARLERQRDGLVSELGRALRDRDAARSARSTIDRLTREIGVLMQQSVRRSEAAGDGSAAFSIEPDPA